MSDKPIPVKMLRSGDAVIGTMIRDRQRVQIGRGVLHQNGDDWFFLHHNPCFDGGRPRGKFEQPHSWTFAIHRDSSLTDGMEFYPLKNMVILEDGDFSLEERR